MKRRSQGENVAKSFGKSATTRSFGPLADEFFSAPSLTPLPTASTGMETPSRASSSAMASLRVIKP